MAAAESLHQLADACRVHRFRAPIAVPEPPWLPCSPVAGAITIDAGALRALYEGRSLLPAGVTGTRGRFDRGDTVSVLAADGVEVARGIIAYSDGDAARIMGRKSSEIAEILGFRGRDEMIHRDDLVLLRQESTVATVAPAPQSAP